MNSLRERLCALSGLAAYVCASFTAIANHTAAVSGPTQYVAEWTYVPDFDQRRALLPNTGRMYCVPTAAMNWMVYIAHHGYPAVSPGDQPYWSWLAPQNYNPATSLIDQMGTLMSTDENNGTDGNGAIAGLTAWLSGQNFILLNYWTHGNVTPRFSDIANWTIAGVPVEPIVGWYSGQDPIYTRSGGHALSVTKVARSGSAMQIEWRDPADETAILFAQSPFASQSYALDPRVVFVAGAWRTMDKVVNYGSGWLDGYEVIWPLSGLTTTDDSLNLVFHKPNKFNWDVSLITQFVAVDLGVILDVKYIPGTCEVLILKEDVLGIAEDRVFRYNPVLGETTPLGDVPDAERMVMGRGGEAYFMTSGGGIMCYLLGDVPWDVTASTYPPDPVKAIAYDDATDSVLALSVDASTLYRFEKTLSNDPVITSIPFHPDFIVEPASPTSFAVSPVDGSLFVVNEAADRILHVTGINGARASVATLADGELVNPRCVQVGDDGRVFVVTEDIIQEYRQNEAGAWEQSGGSNMSGLSAGACLEIPRSRTNWDPETMSGPDYYHVLPTEFGASIPDCVADLDGDMVVDGADLAVMLAAWGEPGDLTDLNGDGATDGADLAALLAAWGDCSPEGS